MASRKRVVIKLSGSIFGDNADTKLRDYAKLLSELNARVQPVVVAGGGKVARHYIGTARKFGADEATLDSVGIEVSRLNARLLIAAIGAEAFPEPPRDLEGVYAAAATGSIVVTGGLHPGQSTNATAALIAEKVRAAKFINATDVEGIYDSDPNKNKDAKMFKEITVKECIKILGTENSSAGAYDLMDLVALKVIERSRLETVVLKSDVGTIKGAVDGKSHGTKISF
jgi:uridylate kinase